MRYGLLAKLHPAFAGRVDDQARATVDALVSHLALPDGASVLDAGCGAGRISLVLAGRGFDVIGVDLDPDVLGLARQQPGADAVTWIHGDLRDVAGPFDAAVFMDVAFGGLDGDDAHRALLSAVPARQILLELYDPEHWRDWIRRTGGVQRFAAGSLLRDRDLVRTYRWEDGWLADDIDVEGMNIPTQRLRAWNAEEVGSLLRSAGWSEVRISKRTPYLWASARRSGDFPGTFVA